MPSSRTRKGWKLMLGRVALTKDQVADLTLIQGLDRKDLERILQGLETTKRPPLSQAGLRHLINDALPPEKQAGAPEVGEALTRVLLGLGGLHLRGVAGLDELLDALGSDLHEEWADHRARIERWNGIRPFLAEMLNLDSVRRTVQALDVCYEYANLLASVYRDRPAKMTPRATEVFKGRVENIVDETALVTLFSQGGETLIAQWPERDLARASIGKSDLFELTMVDTGEAVIPSFRKVPREPIPDELWEEIQRVKAAYSDLEADDVDGDEG
jgi:hypothetical protein